MSHKHDFDGRWPFEEADNTAVYCCVHVVDRGQPILYAVHDHDGDWQFLCGGSHDSADAKLLCFGCVVGGDPSLWTLADLPVGWSAQRERPEAGWNREPHPPEDDDAD